jgi:hypothetical protein
MWRWASQALTMISTSERFIRSFRIEIRLFAIVLYVLHNAAPHHDDGKHGS